MNPNRKPNRRPYWIWEEGWDDAGNCLTCGEAGHCKCPHPALAAPRPAPCRHETPCQPSLDAFLGA